MPTPTFDFSIFDGIELITYQSAYNPPLGNVPAVRRPLTRSAQRNVERYVELQATDVIFHLDATNLMAFPLTTSDTIADVNSISYGVLFVERQTLNNTVVLVCRPAV